MRVLASVWAMLMLCVAAPLPAATLRAVLVGVGSYTDPQLRPLDGARNDALLLAETLLRRFGAARGDIALLTDHSERARPASTLGADAPPTRDAILAALEHAARTTRSGDQLVILLSGHGVRQREAVPGDEPDGLDEAFLPVDSVVPAEAEGPTARYRNAIVDGEIGHAIDAVLDAGGDVFLLADFCHSGDALRGASAAAMAEPEGRIDLAASNPAPGRGGLVAFFTARVDREGAQRAAPFWDLANAAPHGVLSYYTAAALNDPTINRYDELFDRMNALVKASNDALIGDAPAAELPAPQGQLDRPILGRPTIGPARPGWMIEQPLADQNRLTLPAGSLAGIVSGTLFALSAPGREADGPQVYARAEAVGPWSSELRPVRREPPGANAGPRAMALFAREVERPPAPAIAVRLPPSARTAPARRALAALAALDQPALGVRLVNGGRAELILRFVGDALELAVSGRRSAHVYGRVPIGGDQAVVRSTLAATLARAARFHRIAAVLHAMSLNADDRASPIAAVDARFFLRRPQRAPLPGQPCAPAEFAAGEPVPRDALPLPTLGAAGAASPHFGRCDELYLTLANRGDRPLHLFPIVLAPEGAIYVLPTQDYDARLFEPGRAGSARYLLSTEPGDEPLRDDLILIATEVNPQDQEPPIADAIQQPAIICEPAGGTACIAPVARSGREPLSDARRTLLSLLTGTRGLPVSIAQVGFRSVSWYTSRITVGR